MDILDRVRKLENEQVEANEIEQLLLSGKLGNVRTDPDGRQYIGDYPLSWLVVEAHEPYFVEWMQVYKNRHVVHHIDKNPLNNVYINLHIKSRADHSAMHTAEWFADPSNRTTIETISKANAKVMKAWFNDPKNEAAIEQRNKNISDWYVKSENQRAITASNIQRAESNRKFWNDPKNKAVLDGRTEKDAKTMNDFWHNPNNKTVSDDRRTRISDSVIKWQSENQEVLANVGRKIAVQAKTKRAKWLPNFDHPFTAREYAEHYKIEFPTAQYRLRQLEKDNLVQTESTVIDGQRQNVYTTQEV